ncbi:hypothetical protein, partial [Escherichia coli]|uniref:hypothetical protein n=1 Tax=Escherichia coli TaxID=562 RepID=UPI0035C90109
MEKHSCSFLIRAVAGGTTHIIIAISTMYSLILRQNKTDKKSNESTLIQNLLTGFAPIFPDICYHLTHYKPAAADIPVASDNPAHYADA